MSTAIALTHIGPAVGEYFPDVSLPDQRGQPAALRADRYPEVSHATISLSGAGSPNVVGLARSAATGGPRTFSKESRQSAAGRDEEGSFSG